MHVYASENIRGEEHYLFNTKTSCQELKNINSFNQFGHFASHPSLTAMQQPDALPMTLQTFASQQPFSLSSMEQLMAIPTMQQLYTLLPQQSIASLQPLPSYKSVPSSGSPDLALLFNQFICYLTYTSSLFLSDSTCSPLAGFN